MAEEESARVRRELRSRGFAIVRQLLPASAVERARKHLELAVERHLGQQLAEGRLHHTWPDLPLEERMVQAYAGDPEAAPCSWVPQVRHAFAFQQLLFRDPSLCALVSELTAGRPAEVASRFNCRCKLPGTSGAAFPWHQDHAFFRMQYLLKKQPPKRLLAAWAPLVTVDASNGGVEYAVGSHLHGFRRHHREGGFLTVVQEAGRACELHGELPTLEPGDVLLFTDLTLHRSGVNLAPTARWSADWAYELLDSDQICPPLEAVRQAEENGGAHERTEVIEEAETVETVDEVVEVIEASAKSKTTASRGAGSWVVDEELFKVALLAVVVAAAATVAAVTLYRPRLR